MADGVRFLMSHTVTALRSFGGQLDHVEATDSEGRFQFLRADEERLYALLRAHPGDVNVRRLALSATLLLKGRSIEENSDISRTIYRSLSAQDREAFGRLRELRTQRAQLSLQGPGSLPRAAYQQQLSQYEAQLRQYQAQVLPA